MAISAFQRGLRALSKADPSQAQVLHARLLISLGRSQSEVGGLEAGMPSMHQAQELAAALGDPAVQMHLHLQLGYMWMRAGKLDSAKADFDAAAQLIAYAEPAVACNILLNQGGLALYRLDLIQAGTALTECIRRASLEGLRVEEFKGRHNLGYLEYLRGNLAASIRLMQEAVELNADASLAIAFLDRARVLVDAGLYREADEALRDAGSLFRSDRLWQDVGEVELARAECALLDGEIAAARRLAAGARTRFRRRGNDRWRREAEIVLLQADLAAGRPGSRLAAPALRLAEEFRAEGLPTRARTARLIAAEALLRAGRPEQAREVASEAGPVRPSDPVSARLQTRLVRAKLQSAAGDRRGAKREIRTGLAELARHQARFGSLDLRAAGAVHGRQLAELDVSLALSEQDPAGTLAAIEHGRAVTSRLQPVQAPEDGVAVEWLAELRQITEELRAIESDPSAAGRVISQRKKMADIQQKLRSRAWQSEGSGEAGRPAAFSDIIDGLGRHSAGLVSFVQAQGVLHAVVVDGGRARIRTLGPAGAAEEAARRVRADLDVLAGGRLPAALRDAVTGSLNRSLAGLDELLIVPLEMTQGRLILAPTGVLATLPWNLLPSLRGRPVVVAPSATAWLGASAPSSRSGPGAVSVFAGPALDHAAREVREVGRSWPGASVYTDGEARQQALRSALSSSTVVHIAAHGQHQAENPMFSSIRLADGPVFAYELDRTARAAEHVVLSACELGQATIRPGDEALGLTSVLLHLGSRSVVSGVARVHDQVAAEVMVRYHRMLASGLDSATALAEAASLAGPHPAPFVCFGSAWTSEPA
jgi:tetratricopeptide (TPR) repeat protein